MKRSIALLRIVAMPAPLPTSGKLTVGSMARYTLASYAVRDAGLRQ
jgi:hypothetical protein